MSNKKGAKGAPAPAAAGKQPAASNQQLSQKDQGAFRTVVSLYEEKSYKKATKAADKLLEKNPNHGETMAMKGLIFSQLEKKEEALQLVKEAVKHNMQSPICWHVHGIVSKANHDYATAVRCYRMALRLKPAGDSQQILRDLSMAQAQSRDWRGYMETRHKLLEANQKIESHWLGYAVGAHMSGDYATAISVMRAYEKVQDKPNAEKNEKEKNRRIPDNYIYSASYQWKWDDRYDNSELVLYRALLLEESGAPEESLKFLESLEREIVDKISYRETRAALLLKLKRPSEAVEIYRELVSLNTEQHQYHLGLHQALRLANKDGTIETDSKVLEGVYEELLQKYPRSNACKHFMLQFVSADKFKSRLDQLLRPGLRKGVPALFSSFRHLYSRGPQFVADIDELLNSYANGLKADGKLAGEKEAEDPTVLLWTLMLLAQHADKLGQYQRALSLLDEAVAHTPTLLELHVVRARVYKHAGDFVKAAASWESAREMDLQDRYLNTRSTRALLRADKAEQAEKVAALFSTTDGGHSNLHDMQAMWYEQEMGDSFVRTRQFGKALKQFAHIEEHMKTIREDEFDFHSYCLRKLTIRPYVQLLRFENNLRALRAHSKAITSAVKVYISLHDQPVHAATDKSAKEAKAEMTAEQRKAEQKRKKAEALKRAEEAQQAATKKQNSNEQEKDAKGRVRKTDTDPNGDALVAKPALVEATRLLEQILEPCASQLDVQLLAFEVYSRKKKWLLCLRALKRATALAGSNHYRVLSATVRFVQGAQMHLQAGNLAHQVKDLLKSEVDSLLGAAKSPLEICEKFISQNGKDSVNFVEASAAAAEALVAVSADNKKRAGDLLVHTLDKPGSLLAHQCVLKELVKLDPDVAAGYKQKCHALFPLARDFLPPELLVELPPPVEQTED